MIVTLTRTHASPTSPHVKDWQEWAYNAAKVEGCGRLVAPVTMIVTPACKDARGVDPVGSAWPATEGIIDGLIAAGALENKAAVIEVTIRRTRIIGRSQLAVELRDGSEPF